MADVTRSHAGRPARTDKRYASVYAPPETRAALIRGLANDLRIADRSTAIDLAPTPYGWTVTVRDEGGPYVIECDAVVVAAGRFGPLLTAGVLSDRSHRPMRVEVGVRIEQPADVFFLRDDPRADPKLVYEDALNRVSWRTFCCCRDGLVATTVTHGVTSVSGRADCAPTGRSNIGFNVRLSDPDDIAAVWPKLHARLVGRAAPPVSMRLRALLPDACEDSGAEQLKQRLGPPLTARLSVGLAMLLADFPDRQLPEARAIGPTVEGVGMYLDHDDRLASPLPGLWVAGDSSGSFRGLTAAMVSGHLAGTEAAAWVQ
jgi:hypothetical protein